MTRQPDGRWTLVRPVPPGLRQLVVRMDGGAWQAPAGLGTTVDEFGATVGVVLVPARGTP
jgi:hypothetical protein